METVSKKLVQSLTSYVKEGTKLHGNTVNALVKRGWLAEDGEHVTEVGLEAIDMPTIEVTFLQLGSDVTLGKYQLPKGAKLPLVWANREHKDRRKWYFITGLVQPNGKELQLTLAYNPKHEVITQKLPIDTVKEGVLQ